jgi:cyclopropane fatty-acyl-phospholipid synthase-like methyltransferase
MKPKDIGKAYDLITRLWESDNFDKNNGIQQHKRAITFSKNKGVALDVGCGCTGRFIDLLLDKGFEPEGLDVSDEMLKLAKTKHPNTAFYHEDICEWVLPKTYDFITAWDSIWHVPLEQQVNVLTKLLLGLNSGGVFIFSCGGLDDENEHTDDAMGEKIYYSSLGINGFLKVISGAGCICRHMEYDQYPELHTYFIVQKT